MARGEWVHNGKYSYKRTIVVVCSINVVVALYVLHSLHTSLYMYSSNNHTNDEILPGRKLPPECHAELHTDYDGAAVRWGPTHLKGSAYECCMSCLDQAKRARPDEKKCNTWVYCPSETGCYSPDIYEHKNGECRLKYAESPELKFRVISRCTSRCSMGVWCRQRVRVTSPTNWQGRKLKG